LHHILLNSVPGVILVLKRFQVCYRCVGAGSEPAPSLQGRRMRRRYGCEAGLPDLSQ